MFICSLTKLKEETLIINLFYSCHAIVKISDMPRFGKKNASKPEGPRLEPQRVESGWWVLGEGQQASPPPHQLEGLGECCKLPSGVWGRAQPKSNLVHFGFKI